MIQQPATIAAPTWQIKLLYDGECPLCLREVNFLQKRDADRGLVEFVDIADEGYSPNANGGIDYETAMGRIHAVLPDGSIVKNIEVFRRVYEVLGMGWVYAATKLPLIGAIVNFLYGIWADWRLKLTGRPDLAVLIDNRQQLCSTRCSSDLGHDTIHQAEPGEYEAVRQFYRDRQYPGSLNEAAIVLIAQHGDQIGQQIVGVAQLCPEAGYCALRGMQVHPDFQRQGIGSILLQHLTGLIHQPCYCIPWSHLEEFYQQVGFEKIAAAEAPAGVGDRFTHYQSQGLAVILMRHIGI